MESILNKFKSLNDPKYFCCRAMRQFCTPKQDRKTGKPVLYNPTFRVYSLLLDCLDPEYNQPVSIEFCPFCGTRLADAGRIEDAWYMYLEDEYKITQELNEDWEHFFNRVPEEFKTDEWWIKRGL